MRKLRLLALTLGIPFAVGSAACGDDGGTDGPVNGGTQETGTVRFLNVANGLTNPVDIYRRGDVLNSDNPAPLVSDLAFGGLSEAVETTAGTQTYLAFFAGDPAESGRQVFEATGLTVRADEDNVVALFTNADAGTEARAFVDDVEDPSAGNGRFRFFHYANNFGDGSIRLYDAADNRDPLAITQPIPFGQSASDLQLLVGEFTLGFGPSNEDAPEREFEFNVTPGAFKAFLISDGSVDNLYLLDDAGNLSAPIPASDFVPPGQGQVNFVHLANGAGPVDIFVSDDDEPQFTNVQENAATGSRAITEGSYTITVVETGDPIDTAVATLEGFRLGENDTLTVVIYDDAQGNVQIAELPEEDTSEVGAGETKFRVSHFAPTLQNVEVLNAAAEPPTAIGESFNDLAFGATTDYSPVRSTAEGIVLGVDADEDPREDLEVTFDLGQFESASTYNVLLDAVDGSFSALLVASGSGARGPVTGTTIPDPSFIRPIHLASAYGSGPDEAVDFLVEFEGINPQAQGNAIGYLRSRRGMYAEVESGDDVNVSFVAAGGNNTDAITNRNASLGTVEYHTAVLHGARCEPGNDSCTVTVVRDDPPTTSVAAGQVRLRFFHAAPNVPAIDVSSQPGGLSLNLPSEGTVSAYTNVPVGTYQFRVSSGTAIFDFTVDADQWTPQAIYTAFIVQDVDDNQLLILQDQAGNTTTVRQRGEVRAVSLLGNTQGLETNTTFALDGNVVAAWTPIAFATPTPAESVEANNYRGEFNDGVAGTVICNFRVRADELTTVLATGLTNGNTQCLELEENTGAPPASDEIAWRLFHGADRFGDPNNSQINVTILNDNPPTAYNNVGFGSSLFSGFVNRENAGLTLGVDVDPPSMSPTYELIFPIGELNGGESYTFVLTRLAVEQPSPNGGPVVLYAYSDEGDSRIIGARSQASLFNLSPDAGSVDLFIDQAMDPEVTGVAYPGFSDSFALGSGSRELVVVEEGTGIGTPLVSITQPVTAGESARQTAVVFGRSPNRELRLFSNTPVPQQQQPMPGEALVRVIHAAQGFDAVNLYDHTGAPANPPPPPLNAQPVPEGTASAYVTLPAGQPVTLGLDVIATNSPNPMTEKSDYFFELAGLADQQQYNLIVGHDADTGEVVGFLERGVQPFTAPHDVRAADPAARVRVINGSRADNAVDLLLAGAPTGITQVLAGTASRWTPITPGTVDLDIVPSGSPTPRVTQSGVVLESGGSYTLAFADIEGTAVLAVVEQDFAGINDVRARMIHLLDNGAPSYDLVDFVDPGVMMPPFPLIFEDVPQGGASPLAYSAPVAADLRLGLDVDDDGIVDDGLTFAVPSSVMTAGQNVTVVVFTDSAGVPTPIAVLGDSDFQVLGVGPP